MDSDIPVDPGALTKCGECGGVYPAEDMIRFGDINVCARCKPLFMQKLAEGAAIPTSRPRFAGFWRRFGAAFLDGLLLWVVNTVLQFAFFGFFLSRPDPGEVLMLPLLFSYAASIGIGVAYEGGMVAKYGATFGKMACNVKIVTGEGRPVTFGRAVGRHFAKWLSGITLFIGYIIAAFDPEHRSLHDHICNTRVIMT